MFFRQVLHDDLGCASYVVACGGEAAVIDPKWDIADYLDLAEEHGFAIRHILETHNHADHVSGHGRLAEATGATIHVSAEAGVDYAHEPLADGDVVAFGNVRITALATPGHRPEHMAFLIADTGRGDESWLAVTGDSLFVGDLARPDLAVEPEEGAHALFGSLRRLLALDDFAEVWPGHIGGSLCGGAGMSQKPGSTIGFERRYNRMAKMDSEDDFVRALTSHLAAQPPNFKRVVELNRGPLLTEAATVEPHAPARVKQLLDEGATLVDGRATREFDSAHVPGSINVTMTRSAVGTRAAWVVDPATDVVVTAASDAEALPPGPAARGGRLPQHPRSSRGGRRRLAAGRARDRRDAGDRPGRPRGSHPRRRRHRARRTRRRRVGRGPRRRVDPRPLHAAWKRGAGGSDDEREARSPSPAPPATAARSPRRSSRARARPM